MLFTDETKLAQVVEGKEDAIRLQKIIDDLYNWAEEHKEMQGNACGTQEPTRRILHKWGETAGSKTRKRFRNMGGIQLQTVKTVCSTHGKSPHKYLF